MPQEPTDDELDALIVTRLRLVGVDLDQLPAIRSDPVTGSPSRREALEFWDTLPRWSGCRTSSRARKRSLPPTGV
ncbi:MAG: hypothetical protein H0V02_05655 [Nocardioidaceae bacterium]|nr:hypothetical protein [Nocardioidaceae bacterium]